MTKRLVFDAHEAIAHGMSRGRSAIDTLATKPGSIQEYPEYEGCVPKSDFVEEIVTTEVKLRFV